jgi:hypothetical protein
MRGQRRLRLLAQRPRLGMVKKQPGCMQMMKESPPDQTGFFEKSAKPFIYAGALELCHHDLVRHFLSHCVSQRPRSIGSPTEEKVELLSVD